MKAELERLRVENAQVKSKDKGRLTLKVREGRGLPIRHGPLPGHALQRAMAPHPGECAEVEAFIRENDPKLKTKE